MKNINELESNLQKCWLIQNDMKQLDNIRSAKEKIYLDMFYDYAMDIVKYIKMRNNIPFSSLYLIEYINETKFIPNIADFLIWVDNRFKDKVKENA